MPPPEFDSQASFLRLYVENEPSLRGFVRSLVPTLEDAQDVMQEVAAARWKRFHTLSAPGDFRRWTFGVARLESLEFLRKKRRDRHVFGHELLEKLATEAEETADEFVAESKALDVCLQKPPEEQRMLVEAANPMVVGMTAAEAGEIFVTYSVWKKAQSGAGTIKLGAPFPSDDPRHRAMYGIAVK